MSWKFLYHQFDSSQSVSPFDAAIVSTVRDDNICIACPYLGLSYLKRIASLASTWKLVTDISEWLLSQTASERQEVASFISKHQQLIRNFPMLHAKVVIGSNSAVFGSANLTETGITQRVELGMKVDSEDSLKELQYWFKTLWNRAQPVSSAALEQYVDKLNGIPPTPRTKRLPEIPLTNGGKRSLGRLVALSELSSPNHRHRGGRDGDTLNIIETIHKLAPNRDLGRHCLELFSRAIDASGLSGEDPRVVANYSANNVKIIINQRDVIDWSWHHGQSVLGFILGREWLHHPATAIAHEIPKGTYAFKPRHNESDAPVWVRFPLTSMVDLPEELLLNWEESIEREVGRGKHSSYRKHHKPELWDALVHEDSREHLLNIALTEIEPAGFPNLLLLTDAACEEILSKLDFTRDGRNLPDNRRRGRFIAGWQNATKHSREYSAKALGRLTWDNLGYRLGRIYGSHSKDEIIAVFEAFATHYYRQHK